VKNSLIGSIASIVLFSTTLSTANAACERHIYNNSDQPWTITYGDQNPTSVQRGNVFFNGRPDCGQNGPCTIPAKSTVSITYTATNFVTAGGVDFKDSSSNSRNFWYDNSGLPARADICPNINSKGDSSPVLMNEPVDGDVTITDGFWKR
jgi:hypothetical protein